MSHLDVEPVYSVKLTAREFRLVTMGLAGLLNDSDDQAEAEELNVHLCNQRAKHLRSQMEIAEKARDKAVSITAQTERTE